MLMNIGPMGSGEIDPKDQEILRGIGTWLKTNSKGWLEFKEHAFTYSGIVAETSRGPLNYPAINQQMAQMDDFADCIVTGRNTPVPGELGRRDMQIITAIYEAAATGKRVKVRT